MAQEIWKIWYNGLLKEAFDEHRRCIKKVFALAGEILKTSPFWHEAFKVQMADIPQEYFSLRKNIFSTVFQSVYGLLGISENRRLLYGSFNHLFRIWVTSADNLLDGEDKIAVPIDMPGRSRVMRQVVSIMLADRIMKHLFEDAVKKSIISEKHSKTLSDMSLQALLPSAAEEASEEGGITERPSPEYVLNTIHRLKTGFLFQIPFLGLEHVETDTNIERFNICKSALNKFGLGCQLLDDIRDMAEDYLEKRHNYVLSKIYWEGKDKDRARLERLRYSTGTVSKIAPYFSEFVNPAVELAESLLWEGLSLLDTAGLGLGEDIRTKAVFSMFNILGVGELGKCLRQKIMV